MGLWRLLTYRQLKALEDVEVTIKNLTAGFAFAERQGPSPRHAAWKDARQQLSAVCRSPWRSMVFMSPIEVQVALSGTLKHVLQGFVQGVSSRLGSKVPDGVTVPPRPCLGHIVVVLLRPLFAQFNLIARSLAHQLAGCSLGSSSRGRASASVEAPAYGPPSLPCITNSYDPHMNGHQLAVARCID
jgi:hypothetical protein